VREYFESVVNDYNEAYKQDITNHPLVKLITQIIPKAIFEIIVEKERYLIKGSAGAGNWTNTPWVAIFDVLVTNTAQSGYYPVFLFRDDMSGFYLSLNQGVTEIKTKYKREAKQILKLKAEDFRAQLNFLPKNFDKQDISLKRRGSTKSPLPGLYEAGNIIAKYYSAYDLPDDSQLKEDVIEILKLYEILSYNEGLPTTQAEIENDEEKYKGFEDLRRFRFHKRIERNAQLSKKVKKIQGYTCKACKMNFEKVYGELGRSFIEAHHLKPISELSKNKVQLDVRHDFTVLCSNCHSMIHRLPDPSDLSKLVKVLQSKK
jgi:5-methylcytosine-specific restriction protein A